MTPSYWYVGLDAPLLSREVFNVVVARSPDQKIRAFGSTYPPFYPIRLFCIQKCHFEPAPELDDWH